jgi:hypothetical protein
VFAAPAVQAVLYALLFDMVVVDARGVPVRGVQHRLA